MPGTTGYTLVQPGVGGGTTVGAMKTLVRILLSAALLATAFAARADRVFNQAELDALLAPVALYPDSVLSNILVAASFPDDVHEAAAWSRANPQLRGDDAVRMVDTLPWQPSVKALVAVPEVLTRMDESPAWLSDLGEAYRVHGPYVMDTVQSLRQRAQANGYPPSYYEEPASSGVMYVRYYDPFIVYGAWWWPAYRPIVWRPFAPRVVVINRPVYVSRPVVVHRPPVVRGPVVVHQPIMHAQLRIAPEPRRDNGAPSPAQREQQKFAREREKARAPQQGGGYQRVPEDRRRPIVNQNQNHQNQNRQNQHRGGGHRD